jgi:ribosome modulation factor
MKAKESIEVIYLQGYNIGYWQQVHKNPHPVNSIKAHAWNQGHTTGSNRRQLEIAEELLGEKAMGNQIANPKSLAVSEREGYEVGYSGKADNTNPYIETSLYHAAWKTGYDRGCKERLALDHE